LVDLVAHLSHLPALVEIQDRRIGTSIVIIGVGDS
jgi:hypothetical protein